MSKPTREEVIRTLEKRKFNNYGTMADAIMELFEDKPEIPEWEEEFRQLMVDEIGDEPTGPMYDFISQQFKKMGDDIKRWDYGSCIDGGALWSYDINKAIDEVLKHRGIE